MAHLGMDFSDIDDSEMNTGGSWKAWDKGEYRMMVTGSDVTTSKAGDQMVVLEMVCLDGPQEGNGQKDYLVTGHPKETVARIARTRLKELARAVSHPDPNKIEDTCELHGMPFMLFVNRKKTKGEHADADGYENSLGGYSAPPDAVPRSGVPSDKPAPSRATAPVSAGDVPF